jgi:hypothetical protein
MNYKLKKDLLLCRLAWPTTPERRSQALEHRRVMTQARRKVLAYAPIEFHSTGLQLMSRGCLDDLKREIMRVLTQVHYEQMPLLSAFPAPSQQGSDALYRLTINRELALISEDFVEIQERIRQAGTPCARAFDNPQKRIEQVAGIATLPMMPKARQFCEQIAKLTDAQKQHRLAGKLSLFIQQEMTL